MHLSRTWQIFLLLFSFFLSFYVFNMFLDANFCLLDSYWLVLSFLEFTIILFPKNLKQLGENQEEALYIIAFLGNTKFFYRFIRAWFSCVLQRSNIEHDLVTFKLQIFYTIIQFHLKPNEDAFLNIASFLEINCFSIAFNSAMFLVPSFHFRLSIFFFSHFSVFS